MDFSTNNELSHISGRLEQGIASLNSVFVALDLTILGHRQNFHFQAFRSWVFNPPDRTQPYDINFSTLLELRDSINQAFLPYSIDIDAGLLFADGAVITRKAVYYYPTAVPFYGPIFQCDDLTLDEWRSLLITNRPFIPAMPYTSVYYPDREAITWSARWAYMGIPEEIILYAAFPVDDIVAMLVDDDVARAAYVKMYTAQGELLFSRGDETAGSFHVIKRQGSSYSIQYEIGIPDSFIVEKLRPVRNLILIFMFIICALVLVISFFFAWRSTLPVISSIRIIETQTALIRAQTVGRIKNALLSGEGSTANMILRDCYVSLPKPEEPLIAGLLADMLYAMLSDLRGELSELLPPEKIPAFSAPEYIPGSQEDFFERQYPDCFAIICEAVRAHKEESVSAQGRELLAYINDHLYDPDLYITMAADHFGITAPTLQKLVKQCTGQTFQSYVEKCRMDKARELLSTSFDSIDKIAHACGFSSVNTFHVTFKRFYGSSPGSIRKRPVIQ
jgi:AraC-like DNA-binding protein